MKITSYVCTPSTMAGMCALAALFTSGFWLLTSGCGRSERDQYAGSASCRECHADFYKKWSTSYHGTAMQPFTREFAEKNLTPLAEPFVINDYSYTVALDQMIMYEHEPSGKTNELKFVHALGGKNLYYFLTPLERGKLQVLPLAYDTGSSSWYNTTTSMMRHFLEDGDQPLFWRDPMLTFNTSCHGCHVSQLSKNYDPATDSYQTEWREPGISCESCHGPCAAHNRAALKAARQGKPLTDLKLKNWKQYSVEQANHACSTCHAKFIPITDSFTPGDNYFDHYDLICLENRDFSPDGRDLGENYTFTLASMSPCVKSGQLDCVFCHTSSGRYRFADDNPNQACADCHQERVDTITAHSRHSAAGSAGKCIACHMPTTAFARMQRCDHSMRPPSPAASRLYGSKSACVICHEKLGGEKDTPQDEAWAAGFVKQWHPASTWQPRIVYEGGLVSAAHHGDWTQLDAILKFIQNPESDAIIITSLIRLIQVNPERGRWVPALQAVAGHESPLVRSAVAVALGQDLTDPEIVRVLLDLLKDERRLVRVRAATGLAQYPRTRLDAATLQVLKKAEEEVMAMFAASPDSWSSYYNQGNYMLQRGDPLAAMGAYKIAMNLRPDVVVSFVNAAVLASQQGNLDEGIGYLKQAQLAEPEGGAVNLNLGLALAEKGDRKGALKCLRVAMKEPACRAQAAFNCAVLVGESDLERAIQFARIAADAQPSNRQYMEALQYYSSREGAGPRRLAPAR